MRSSQTQLHLWLNFYLARPVFGDSQLGGLHNLLRELLPEWSAEMGVSRGESSRNRARVGAHDRLLDVVSKAAPPRRGLGGALLTGSYEGVSIYLDTCGSTLPPELNRIAVEVELAYVEGIPVTVWVQKLFESLIERMPVRYANVRSSEEYESKNIVKNDGTVRAVGTLLERSLPGIYWLNFFGLPYVRMFGDNCLMTTPAYFLKKLDDGVLISLDASPEFWNTKSYRDRETEVISHLGQKYFFVRDSEQETIAPDFR